MFLSSFFMNAIALEKVSRVVFFFSYSLKAAVASLASIFSFKFPLCSLLAACHGQFEHFHSVLMHVPPVAYGLEPFICLGYLSQQCELLDFQVAA